MRKYPPLSKSKKEELIKRVMNQEEIKDIADEFNVQIDTIKRIMRQELKKKNNN